MSEELHLSNGAGIENVGDVLVSFRESIRHLWNNVVLVPELATFDTVDALREVESLLFDLMVVPRLEARFEAPLGHECRDRMRVVPSARDGVPIMIENPRPGTKNRYWDHPIRRIRPGDAELRFVGYFDWDDLRARDYQYYETEILGFVGHEELRGRRALLQVGHADVILLRKA